MGTKNMLHFFSSNHKTLSVQILDTLKYIHSIKLRQSALFRVTYSLHYIL